MRTFRRGHGRRAGVLTAVAAAVAVVGGTCIGLAVAAQQSAPQPPAATATAPVLTDLTSPIAVAPPPVSATRSAAPSSAAPVPAPSTTPARISGAGKESTRNNGAATTNAAGARTPPAPPAGIAPSAPATLSIPAIGVQASFVQLGLNPDGSIQVPSDVRHVGWYRLGPAPGQTGPAVVLGHIDSAKSGPGVFFKLGALRPGDTVGVARGDGHTVTFVVYAVREYPKDAFPTSTVYGNTSDPQLRLITCGGSFDHATGHYRSNIVVFARES